MNIEEEVNKIISSVEDISVKSDSNNEISEAKKEMTIKSEEEAFHYDYSRNKKMEEENEEREDGRSDENSEEELESQIAKLKEKITLMENRLKKKRLRKKTHFKKEDN